MLSVLGVMEAGAVQPLIENATQLGPGTARDLTIGALESFESGGDEAGFAYGTIVILLWPGIANIAMLIGAELNAELERTQAKHRQSLRHGRSRSRET